MDRRSLPLQIPDSGVAFQRSFLASAQSVATTTTAAARVRNFSLMVIAAFTVSRSTATVAAVTHSLVA